MAFLDLGVAAVIGLPFQRLPIAVGDEGVIGVSGEEGELGTGRRLHPPDNEPHRRGVRLGLERGVSRLGDIGGAVHPVGNGSQSSSGIASIRSRRLARWRMVIEKRTSISRQAATTEWA